MGYEGYGNSHVSVGPWGGQSGARRDDGVYSTARQVVICHGVPIDSIQFEYNERGSSVWSEKHGGTGCLKTNKASIIGCKCHTNLLNKIYNAFPSRIPGSNLQVKLDYPDEYPVSISGYICCLVEYGPVLVRSLMFETNKKKYRPFGIHYGTYFSNPMAGGKIVGFHGRSSWYLDSIGDYLMPLLRRNPSNTFSTPQYYTTNGNNEKNKGYNYDLEDGLSNKVVVSRLETHSIGFVNTKQAVSHGTWGGNGGNIFDDRVYT